MTAAEFEGVVPLLRIASDRIEAARAVLVEGQTMQATAQRFGWASRNSVLDAVNAAWRAFDSLHASQAAAARAATVLPPGWEQVTFIAPAPLIARFRAELEETLSGSSSPAGADPSPSPNKRARSARGAPGRRST
jgi:hypothetical protein